MDWVDTDGFNQKGMSCAPATSYRRLKPLTEHSAADMDAPEHDEPLPAQDPPELSVTDVQVGDSAVDIGTGEAADDNPMRSSPTNKIFKIPPGISNVGSGIADITFVSTDQMTFQVHRAVICARSSNDFGYVVQDKRLTINVPETSAILNAILCAIYDFPGEASLDTLKVAVGRMEKYGLTPSRFILPTKAAFVELCMHADQHPMDVFILAAKHDLDQVAQFASSHLLSFNLPSVTDEMAEEMGVMYLRRLFFLHMERLDRLKEYLTIEPVVHDALDTCEGNSAKRAWVFPAVSLITSGRHDISPEEITTAMVSSADELWCSVCCGNYMQQVSATVEMWSAVRSTI